MKYDEFAFFNQQLASMLRDGIPLEGALKQLCQGMQSGALRAQLEGLERELAGGTPLSEALGRSELPELYRRMLAIGAHSNNLPAMLNLLADHYHRVNSLWTRLKGLMVYPIIVIAVSAGLTLMLSMMLSHFLAEFPAGFFNGPPPWVRQVVWIPPIVLGLLTLAGICAATIPSLRGRIRWVLPPFREASLAQLGSAMSLMLGNGLTLAEALALAETLESGTPAEATLRDWRARVERGEGKPAQWAEARRPFPRLFLWLVQRGGEDVAAGFRKAAEIYQGRAAYRGEMLLYGALPVSVVFLGQMVLWQAAPLFQTLISFMNMICDFGGGGKD